MVNEVLTDENGQIIQGSISTYDYDSNFVSYGFHVINSHGVNFQSQITDNYLENNTAVQDHITLSPITITMSGLCAELVYTAEQAEQDAQNQYITAQKYANAQNFLINKLGTITSILPSVSNITRLAMNVYDYAASSFNRYFGIVRRFKNSNNPMNTYNGLTPTQRQSKMKQATDYLAGCWRDRVPFRVDTPWGIYEDMYVQSLSIQQGNENFITNIEITLKQLRFAEITTTKVDEKVMSKYNAQARANQQNNGKAQGKNKSFAAQAYDARDIFAPFKSPD